MPTYALVFDSSGKTYEKFTVPQGKRVYLTRGEQASEGTATVTDFISLNTYTIPDGATICVTPIKAGTEVSLAFMARSNDLISVVLAEVISPRTGVSPCE